MNDALKSKPKITFTEKTKKKKTKKKTERTTLARKTIVTNSSTEVEVDAEAGRDAIHRKLRTVVRERCLSKSGTCVLYGYSFKLVGGHQLQAFDIDKERVGLAEAFRRITPR